MSPTDRIVINMSRAHKQTYMIDTKTSGCNETCYLKLFILTVKFTYIAIHIIVHVY